jgi:hypothetical protein
VRPSLNVSDRDGRAPGDEHVQHAPDRPRRGWSWLWISARRTETIVRRLADLAHDAVRREQEQRRVYHERDAARVTECHCGRYAPRDRSARCRRPDTLDLVSQRIRFKREQKLHWRATSACQVAQNEGLALVAALRAHSDRK